MSSLPRPVTVGEALRAAGLDRIDAQVLLLHALGRSPHDRAWLIAHGTDPLPPETAQQFALLCERRRRGEPVAYLTGLREFHGLSLAVDPRVLDPRPDTETLVDWALDILGPVKAPRVLDLGTGSGAIALALKHRRPDADVWALDASPDALEVARTNAHRLALDVHFLQGHWLSGWPVATTRSDSRDTQDARPTRFDLIVSNPPYIRSGDPHLATLTHEPLQALTSGADGLEDIRAIIADAPSHLSADGWLLLEHGWDQGSEVSLLLENTGCLQVEHRQDLAGHIRCTGATWSNQSTQH